MKLENELCRQARLSKDARFDGSFFTAVKTTGIYCRSICPAPSPKEQNVEYFGSSVEAETAGYRPCLRCRPDSAPNSYAWKGTDTTLERALNLLDSEDCESLTALSDRLGIGDRYLRKLFQNKLGVSPKQYQLHQRMLFAKKLLHETQMSMSDIAYSAGFGSVRRFNELFQKSWQLTPSEIRRQKQQQEPTWLTLQLNYRPPYNVDSLFNFFSSRLIEGAEWLRDRIYGRGFQLEDVQGWFEAEFLTDKPAVAIKIAISDYRMLKPVLSQIKRVLDLNADMQLIHSALNKAGFVSAAETGIRLPGCWSIFEAGVRAILGQQVSVKAATNLVNQVVYELGSEVEISGKTVRLFPTPEILADSELLFLKMPQSRRDTLIRLAQYCAQHPDQIDLEKWMDIKGIGRWTLDYAKMRGQSDTNIWLEKDLGIIKAVANFDLKPENAAPWQSYLTFNLWNTLYQ